METEKDVISVIVPVYNASATLETCLNSLFRQSYPYLEILIIDDCSKDTSLDIIHNLVVCNKGEKMTVKVLCHEVNKGVAAARNTGLRNATGTFIYYVDSDDYVEPEALEILYREIKKNEKDIVGCEWFLSFQTNERYMVQPSALTGEKMFRKMAEGGMRWNLWLYLVRHSLYRNNRIWFTEGMNMGEDMMVMLKLVLCARKVSIIHKGLYHYRQTNLLSLTSIYSEEHRMQVSANVNELERYISSSTRKDLHEQLCLLKLTVKLPLLVSSKVSDYKLWLEWFPESNEYVNTYEFTSWRVRFIQKAALKRQYWILQAYYRIVVKIVYGIIYK